MTPTDDNDNTTDTDNHSLFCAIFTNNKTKHTEVDDGSGGSDDVVCLTVSDTITIVVFVGYDCCSVGCLGFQESEPGVA